MTPPERTIRVVLVEDNPGDARLVREALREIPSVHFDVRLAERLADAAFDDWRPEVALLDLSLPDSSGTSTVVAFRERHPDVPIVVLTGLDDDRTAVEALRIGAQDYVVKDDVSPRRLAQSIRYALERHRLGAELERRTRDLEESEERLATVLESLADGVVVVDEGDVIVLANPAACRALGRNRDDLVGSACDLPVADHEAPTSWRRSSPKPAIELELRATPVRWRGRPARVVLVQDVTSRAEAERVLRQRERLETVSRLAGGLAHGLNNVLQSISTAGSLIGAVDGLPAAAERPLRTIDDEVARGATLTRQLLVFSGQDIRQPTAVDVAHSVHRLRPRLAEILREDIHLEITTDRGPARVEIDRAALDLVIDNLVRNAGEATAGGGTVSILVDREPEAEVRLTVRDSGRGIASGELRKVFEPFYSTKGPAGAHGLGLSVVHGIVESAGGTVDVASEVGSGTTVTVRLPAARETAVHDPPPGAGGGTRDSGPILVIEDETAAREGLVDLLELMGQTVVAAESGEEGLALAAAHGCRLLLTDHSLPGISGETVASRLRSERPDVPVILMSGYPPSESIHDDVRAGRLTFLQKPFRADALRAVLAAALGGDPAGVSPETETNTRLDTP